MSSEKILALKSQISMMKKMTPDGFSSEAQAATYFAEKEAMLEDIVKALESIHDSTTTETECVKDAIKSLKDGYRHLESNGRQITGKDLEYQLGKAVCAAWTGDRTTLGELKCIPNLKTETWNNPSDFEWTREKGFTLRKKDNTVEPMGNMATNDQYLINPVYEDMILETAGKKSVMMDLVSHVPMKSPSIWLPVRERGGARLKWLTAYGQKIEATKVNSPTRKELRAYTLAGYIPWYDEFEEDVFADLGKMFISEFTDSYAEEFDRQCLIAENAPFIGLLKESGAVKHEVDADIKKLTYIDFRDAEIKVPAEERKNCRWFFSESVLNMIANITDDNGNPIWRRPGDSMPGMIDGYRYHDSTLLPQLSDIGAGTAFAIFADPRRIRHGNRKGIEIKRYTETRENLETGENDLRFRKRDGFLTIMPEKNIVVMKTKSE